MAAPSHLGLLVRRVATLATLSAAASFAIYAFLYPAALCGDLATFGATIAGAVHPRRCGWLISAVVLGSQYMIAIHAYIVMPWPESPAISLTLVIRPNAWHICWTIMHACFAITMAGLLLLHLLSGFVLTALSCHPILVTIWVAAAARGWSQ
jgi:hypothetical protein